MSSRNVTFKPNARIQPCPKCSNRLHFIIISQQVAEDYCEVWARCACGHEPPRDHAFEDVWGGVGNDNVVAAISCWNDYAAGLPATPDAMLAASQQAKEGGR